MDNVGTEGHAMAGFGIVTLCNALAKFTFSESQLLLILAFRQCSSRNNTRSGTALGISTQRSSSIPPHTAAFSVAKPTRSAVSHLAAGAEIVDRRLHSLNQYRMRIPIGALDYQFEYAGLALSSDHYEAMRRD